MAPGLSAPAPPRTGGPGTARPVLLAFSVALLLLVGLSRPNAAQPDLLPRGWAPGTLLPLTLEPAVVTAVLWGAYGLGAVAVVLGLRSGAPALRTWWVPAGLGVAALLTSPFGSADHVSYVAYGRVLVGGGDPWVESPATWGGGADPVTSRVEAPWTEEPSVYGPAATALHALAAWAGDGSLRQGVWVWQVVVVLAWLGVRLALRAALPGEQHGRVDVAWTLNPLVLGVGVLGAHVDVVAAAWVVAAVAVVARRAGSAGALAAGALVGVAASTKVTYGVGLVALGAAWWMVRGDGAHGRQATAGAQAAARAAGSGRAAARVATAAAGFVAAAAVLHVWAGPHVYDQLVRSRQAVSLATPWRLLLEVLRPGLGNASARTVVTVAAALLAVLLAVALLRRTRPAAPASRAAAPAATPAAPAAGEQARWAATALWLLAVLQLAYVLAAPYSLPWYDALVWATLPALVPGVADLLALARLAVATAAYVPGRVLGSTPDVEALTLGFRRSVAPWLVLALWVAVLSAGAARRGSRTVSAPPPGAPPRTPTR